MKKLLVALLTLGSFSVFASNPGVGTFSEYSVSSNGFYGIYRVEIIDYNESLNQFTQLYTTNLAGNTSTEKEVLSGDQVNTKEMNELIPQLCEKEFQGKLEVVHVSAGSFESCKVDSEDGSTIYMAAVPFGFIKIITADGTKLELQSYSYK